MRRILGISIFLFLFTFSFANEDFNTHVVDRPLIVEFSENNEPHLKKTVDELQLECTSWRFGVEANNLSPWKTIPEERADYVREYITGGAYEMEIDRVSSEAGAYAQSMELGKDGKDIWIFDIDETLLSNLPYYSQHGYGMEVFDSIEFDKWVEKGVAPAIGSSLKLYEDVMRVGFKVFLLTGRSERHRIVTVENLMNAGFQDWDKLILRGSEDHGKLEINGVMCWALRQHSNFLTQCTTFLDIPQYFSAPNNGNNYIQLCIIGIRMSMMIDLD